MICRVNVKNVGNGKRLPPGKSVGYYNDSGKSHDDLSEGSSWRG